MRIKEGKKTRKKSPDEGIELEGLYANIFKVGYNPSEFVLDFGQYFSEQGKEQFHTRIVTTQEYVKLFFELLQEAINQYKVSISDISDDKED